ncbi:sugar ABC transporter permease [bacterium]|nr:sugar ABC transporter permease [bacterium]
MAGISHRRRFAIGLFFGLIVGLAVLYALYREARIEIAREQADRSGIISLLSLTQLVSETGPSGDALRQAVSAVASSDPSLKKISVIRGASLEASTAPQDAAPRRLKRDEKPIFDLGQRLRSAVQTNREEQVARKNEIEIQQIGNGAIRLAAPVEQDGSVTGFVMIETSPSPQPSTPAIFTPILIALIALAVFIGAGFLFDEKKIAIAVLGFVVLSAALISYGIIVKRATESENMTLENKLAQQLTEQSKRSAALLTQLGITAKTPSKPGSWDTDVYRKPRGILTDEGTINQSVLANKERSFNDQVNKFLIGIVVFCLGILSFFGFGVASKLAQTVVQHRQAYMYVTPAMIAMLVLVFFPFLYGIVLSFTGSTLYNTEKPITEIWTGLRNYFDILGDFSIVKRTDEGLSINYQNFYWTFIFTILWTVSNVTIGVTVGLILALMLNTKGLALRPLYRVLLIFPWAMPNYITALIWRGMFHQQFGVINQIIQLFGGTPVSWFEKPFTSFLTALTTNGWLSFPFMMVVSLGALQSIPSDLYEAARVDGASRWQQFRSITLPSLKPALVPAIILSVVWTFNMFNIIFLVTAGEPAGSTEILITQAYKIAFQQYRYGYAAAYSTIIFLILLIYGSIQNKVTKATEAIA